MPSRTARKAPSAHAIIEDEDEEDEDESGAQVVCVLMDSRRTPVGYLCIRRQVSDLEMQPVLKTYNDPGTLIMPPRALQIRAENEEGGVSTLRTRALLAYATPQTMEHAGGASVCDTGGDIFVSLRANGTYGYSRIWTAKYDEHFKERFECATNNPDSRVFKPQAAFEFERSINKLFGRGATERVPILYARPHHQHSERGLCTLAERRILSFTPQPPNIVDQLKIAKILDGLETMVCRKDTLACSLLLPFECSPTVVYAMYTKSHETAAMLKPLTIFQGVHAGCGDHAHWEDATGSGCTLRGFHSCRCGRGRRDSIKLRVLESFQISCEFNLLSTVTCTVQGEWRERDRVTCACPCPMIQFFYLHFFFGTCTESQISDADQTTSTSYNELILLYQARGIDRG